MKRQKRRINSKNKKVKNGIELFDSEKMNQTSEHVCCICKSIGAELYCNGACKKSFHKICVSGEINENFTCDDCTFDNHPCFCCKKTQGDLRKCSVESCGKFYHDSCLFQLGFVNSENIFCPCHSCSTCKQNFTITDSSVNCVRCPNAYHTEGNCVAAGCQKLSESFVLCPDHFIPKQGVLFQSLVNIPWCSICTTGGNLIHCKSCPASFHSKCITDHVNDIAYICERCKSRKQVIHGSIVWVKIGSFRWWPARIMKVDDIPASLKSVIYSVGEFPIQYFGTKEYFWTNKSRVYPYFVIDQDTIESTQCQSVVESRYKTSIIEANDALGKLQITNLSDNSISKPQYKRIKVNHPIGKVQILTLDKASLAKCTCTPKSIDPCGYTSDCLNRSALVECHPDVCIAGDLCQNQLFVKRKYPKLQAYKTKDRGWALKTLEDINAGHFVIEYIGDLIDEVECMQRLADKHIKNDKNYYFLTLDRDRIIDAGPRSNYSRFFNHSCEPNCETQKWIVNGDFRVGLFAKFNILAGTELTFDYMMDSFNNEKLPCFCGARTCRGAIGVKTQKALSKAEINKKLSKKTKKTSRKEMNGKKSCFLCGMSGKLTKCDFKGCSKLYHMPCLGRSSIPVGRWQCPSHHCITCGRLSEYTCSKCTIAFCENHKTKENMSQAVDKFMCFKHIDEQ